MSEWNPIATVPRDGREFLGYDSKNKKFGVCWAAQYGIGLAHSVDSDYMNADEFESEQATHWMKLPEPPK